MVSALEGQTEQVKADVGMNEAVLMERGPPPGYRGAGLASFEEKAKRFGAAETRDPQKKTMMVWKFQGGR